MCVHIGVGFGVACSELRAIPGPRNAEQQQCSPAFFVSCCETLTQNRYANHIRSFEFTLLANLWQSK